MKLPLLSVFCLGAFCAALPCPSWAEAPNGLKERQAKTQQVARDCLPAVVCVMPDYPEGKAERERLTDLAKRGKKIPSGSGSGVIVDKDGLVLTAAHVLEAVAPEGENIRIVLADGNYVKAKPLGMNKNRDAALAQIVEPGPFPFVPMADPDSLKEGEWVVAFGHHGGFEIDRPAPLRIGRIISGDTDGFVVTDSTLSGGDSGGPLFDLTGKLVGIHSSISWSTSVNRHVPISAFKKHWDRMKKGDTWGELSLTPKNRPKNDFKPEQPRLGVAVGPNDEGDAVTVHQVAPGSPAEKAGIKTGDEILKVNETDITVQEDLTSKIKSMKPGDKVIVTIRRDGEKQKLEVTLIASKDIKDESDDE